MAFCTGCGVQVAEGSNLCPACSAKAAVATQTSAAGMTDNIAGALAYVTPIPAVIFLVVAPYNKNRFVRFHAFQSLFVFVCLFVFNLVVFSLLAGDWWSAMNGGLRLYELVRLAEFIFLLVLLVKAYQGHKFKVPVIGDFAEKQADAV